MGREGMSSDKLEAFTTAAPLPTVAQWFNYLAVWRSDFISLIEGWITTDHPFPLFFALQIVSWKSWSFTNFHPRVLMLSFETPFPLAYIKTKQSILSKARCIIHLGIKCVSARLCHLCASQFLGADSINRLVAPPYLNRWFYDLEWPLILVFYSILASFFMGCFTAIQAFPAF